MPIIPPSSPLVCAKDVDMAVTAITVAATGIKNSFFNDTGILLFATVSNGRRPWGTKGPWAMIEIKPAMITYHVCVK
jgi:hypothetical protein